MDKLCENITPDSGNTMTLVDRTFLKRQAPTLTVKRVPRAIGIRGVGDNLSSTDGYAVVTLHLPGKLRNGTNGVAEIKFEAHVVDNLPANLLLGSDVMKPNGMDVLYSRDVMAVTPCQGIEIPISAYTRDNRRINRVVKAMGETIVPPRSVASIPITFKKGYLPNRDYLFQPNTKNRIEKYGDEGGPFAHLVDANFDFIQAYNATSALISIEKNEKLGHLVEFEEEQALHADPSIHTMAAEPKSIYGLNISDGSPTTFVKSPPDPAELADEDTPDLFQTPPGHSAKTESNDGGIES